MLRRWIGALAAILILAALFSYAAPQDPLADFRNADGTITVPGGQLTPGLQRLLFPEPPPDHTYTFARERFSPYPTLAWVGVRHGAKDGAVVTSQVPSGIAPPLSTIAAPSAIPPEVASPPDAEPMQATETWYARATNDALACGSDLNKDASETQGTAVATHVLDGTYDYWYGSDEARTIEAGNWVVTFWTTTAGGGGPPGKVTVIVERIVKATCAVQQLIVSEEITMSAGTTGSYATTPVDPGQVVVASGEQVIYRFAKTGGTRTVTLRYDFNDANTANTRLVHPDTAPVAPSVTTNAATDVTSDSATLNGNLDSMGSCSSVDASFEWDIDTGEPYANETSPPTTMTGTGPFSFGLTGLDASTTYYFRAKATGTCGTSFGGELNFTTDPPASTTAYLVLGDPQCVVTAIATDLDCWSSTSGGNGDGLPDGTEQCVADANSGAGTGTMDAALTCGTTAMDTTGFTGTIAIAGQTLTLNAGLTHAGGTITVTTGTLAAGANAVSITSALTSTGACSVTSGAMTVGAGGTLTANACTITVSGNFNFLVGTFAFGTSTLVFASNGTLTPVTCNGLANNLYNLTVNASVNLTGAGRMCIGNVLNMGNSSTITSNSYVDLRASSGTADPLVLGTGVTLGPLSGFVFGQGATVAYNIPGMSPSLNDRFYIRSSTAATLTGNLTVSGLNLDSNAPGFVTGANAVSIGALGFNLIASASGAYVTSTAAGSWTVSGIWTNSSTSASWSFAAPITFTSPSNQTMTFAGSNLAVAEFNDVTFTSSAASPQTFTMATRALRWGGTLTVSDTSSSTELATSDLGLSTGAVVVGNGGILTANASTVVVTSVTMTGGTSGIITVTTGDWTVSGGWDTSGAGSTYTQGTGLVTIDATATITMLSTDNTFDDLTISAGTSTLASAIGITNTLTVSDGAVLAAVSFDIRFDHLDIDGAMTMDGETVDDIDIDGSAGTILLTDWTAYAITNGIPDIRWTMDPDTASSDIAFTVAGLATTLSVSLYRDDLEVAKADADGIGSWSVSLAGGWSPHEMRIGEPVPGGHTDPRYRAVIVSCSYRWPENAVHCSAIERIDPRFVATRSWVVDGRVVDGASDASLDYDLGILPGVPIDRAMTVTYVIRTTGDADVFDSVTVRLDSSWLWAAYGLAFIGVLGLVVVRRSERHTGREEPMP